MRDMQALCRRYAGVMRYMQGHVGVMQASMEASCRGHALHAGVMQASCVTCKPGCLQYHLQGPRCHHGTRGVLRQCSFGVV